MRENINYEYELPEYNDKELNYLRENTRLGILASTKVAVARRQAEKYWETYKKLEPTDLAFEVDYSTANYLEWSLRKSAWEHRWEKSWAKYGEGESLMEYADIALKENMQMEDKKYS